MSNKQTFKDFLLSSLEYRIQVFMGMNPVTARQLELQKDTINKLGEEELILRYPAEYKLYQKQKN